MLQTLTSENTFRNGEPCWRKMAETKTQQDPRVTDFPKMHPKPASPLPQQWLTPGLSSKMKSSSRFCILKYWVIFERWGLWSLISQISASSWVLNKSLYRVSLEKDLSRPANLTTSIWRSSLHPSEWLFSIEFAVCVCVCGCVCVF